MAKRNWDIVSKQKATDTMKNRDVFEDQQLERSKIEEPQSPASRIILSIVMSILVAIVAYFLACIFQFGSDSMKQLQAVGSATDATTSSVSSTATEKETEHYVEKVTPDGIRYITDDGVEHVDVPYLETTVESTGSSDSTVIDDGTSVVETVADESTSAVAKHDVFYYLAPTWWKIAFALFAGLMCFLIMYQIMMRNLEAQNLMNDTTDINQYQNDQHIALPEEIQRKFDWFPDVGAHSNVQVSSMISHMALVNKGLKKIHLSRRAKDDIKDEDGDVEIYKGEVLYDENDEALYDEVPLIDEKFGDALFEASGAPKEVRKYYDATKIPYNGDGKDRTKQGGTHKTVADMINADWVFPDYEPQRPAGAFIVDTEPVNTMVLAITRAGKGNVARFVS